MDCKYSIVVPMYNKEKYIKKCIESLKAQNFSDFEVILVDDGSTDQTKEIVRAEVEKDKRFIYIYEENTGVVCARQKGISHAKGEYVLHLDPDDFWEPNLLQTIDEKIRKYRCDILQFGYNMWESGKKGNCVRLFEKDTFFGRERKEEFVHIVLREAPSMCLKVFKRILLVVPEDYWKEWNHICDNEDVLQTTLPVCRAESMLFIGDPLYNYCIYSESISHGFDRKHLFDGYEVLEGQLKILKEYSLDMPENVDLCYGLLLKYMTNIYMKIFSSNLKKNEKREIIKKIRKHPIFKESKRMEKHCVKRWDTWLKLKMFRYGQYWYFGLKYAIVYLKDVFRFQTE